MANRTAAPAAARGSDSTTPADATLPLRYWLPAAVAALCIALLVTHPISDPDVWQHLAVGRHIWNTHSIPHAHLWSWPTYGQPDVTHSWLFRALLWPFWNYGQSVGLFAWRWLFAIGAFAILYCAARAMRANPGIALVICVLCASIYRGRSQLRPETLAAIPLALMILILELRRQRAVDRLIWLPVLMCVWINIHISFYLGFVILGAYWLDDLIARRRRLQLPLIALLAAGAVFINPFGWELVRQPWEFWSTLRHEPLFKAGIGELLAPQWHVSSLQLLPVLIVGWPLLVLWGLVRRRFDLAELALCGLAVTQALSSQRFGGTMALLAVPFVARGITFVWPRPLAIPTSGSAVACIALMLTIALPHFMRRDEPLKMGWAWQDFPVAACDAIDSLDVRGRSFNQFWLAGNMLYGFAPDTTRLPFMDIHQSGTRLDRTLYFYGQHHATAWDSLDAKHRFDYVLLAHNYESASWLPDILEQSDRWRLVFSDDAAMLYLRSDGRNAEASARHGFTHLKGSNFGTAQLVQACWGDSLLRGLVAAEVRRQVQSSPWNSRAHILLGTLDAMDGSFADATAEFRRALESNPRVRGAHARLSELALLDGRYDEALRGLDNEREVGGNVRDYHYRRARILQQAGRMSAAIQEYRRSARQESSPAARDSLARLGAGS